MFQKSGKLCEIPREQSVCVWWGKWANSVLAMPFKWPSCLFIPRSKFLVNIFTAEMLIAET